MDVRPRYRHWRREYKQYGFRPKDLYDKARVHGQVGTHALFSYPKVQAATQCMLEDDERNVVAEGWAFCSVQDQFSKAIGRQISEGRARAQLEGK